MARKKKSEFDLVHASVDQIREIKNDIAHLERMLKADQSQTTPKITDVTEFKAEIAKKKKLIKNHAPKKLKGKEASKAYAKAKELKKIIQEAMPSSKEYYRPYPKGENGHNFDFERAVKQQMAFQTDPKIQKAVINYKSILRRIDPDNPEITNIELLRK